MDVKGYMLDVFREPIPYRLELGDEIFLIYIADGKNSAYKIYSHENNRGFNISYKNVHRRVNKLLKYGLIEEITVLGGFKHGAKNYRLKTRGLIYFYSEILATRNLVNIILSHQDNIIFKTFLEPYFERRTIKNATYTLMQLITNYIIECCEITKYCLNLTIQYLGDDQTLPESDLYNTIPINYMYYRLISCIESFIIRSAILNEMLEDWMSYVMNKGWRSDPLPSEGKISCLANDKKETQLLLVKDKKFMNKLRSIEDKFRDGFTTLADLEGIE